MPLRRRNQRFGLMFCIPWRTLWFYLWLVSLSIRLVLCPCTWEARKWVSREKTLKPIYIYLHSLQWITYDIMKLYLYNSSLYFCHIDSSNGCWIVGYLSNLLFFQIPVGVTLGFNVICLIWTVIGITRVQKVRYFV